MESDIQKFFQQQITAPIRQQFLDYVEKLKADPQMQIFVKPAAPQLVLKEQRKQYQTKITHPICLNDITERCETGQYFLTGQFFSALLLISQNCEYGVRFSDGKLQFRELTRALDRMTIDFMNKIGISKREITISQLPFIRDLALKNYLDQQLPTVLLKT